MYEAEEDKDDDKEAMEEISEDHGHQAALGQAERPVHVSSAVPSSSTKSLGALELLYPANLGKDRAAACGMVRP
eukprot:CAMPEP_0194760906 /NCGR_PEP_ID=MMETSP0323_2-20130528/13730_1 /TAXON_ID=2866 ORGANISM="Crypthecodinium cohnii, Strain Seligo" /NCGR_SAMPLE_ID=MMETSP0323_2 /ASSEMBLY_ACC=CAM_ASM_000346 /LENGTH=73 /DNA_ID=CAMNT_0039682415 /DNA_START=147 /DNA_END=369 /DNA_ORIENTATION=-